MLSYLQLLVGVVALGLSVGLSIVLGFHLMPLSRAALRTLLTGLACASCDPDDVRRCRSCGCTDDDCSRCIERTGAPCWWVAPDLCSACDPTGERR